MSVRWMALAAVGAGCSGGGGSDTGVDDPTGSLPGTTPDGEVAFEAQTWAFAVDDGWTALSITETDDLTACTTAESSSVWPGAAGDQVVLGFDAGADPCPVGLTSMRACTDGLVGPGCGEYRVWGASGDVQLVPLGSGAVDVSSDGGQCRFVVELTLADGRRLTAEKAVPYDPSSDETGFCARP